MAKFGIEGIRSFSNARAAGVSTAGDLTYTFNICNGFDSKLRSAGHTRSFYFANTDCWETDIRDSDKGGDDVNWVDNVDIFWISTHGNHTSDGQARLLYDIPRKNWRTFSGQWQLGENWNAEWVMAFSCETVDRNNVSGLWNIFAGMHIYCGAWGKMYDGITTDECGEDVAENLINGHTISEAWIDGVSDWWVDNHPITVCVGDADTWNGGNIKWERSYLNRDHLWGHGNVDPDLPPAKQSCILCRWAEG
ncbi:hypothetical protein Cylst_0761 [Cylindrospermum stagnale PCC 7417]|uniref:CHAT domain-containing protein n=1 Tax=Cylindrospermum stagnale PCC 7417 TaxID=56107 RepID=K9WSC3_9NOST|nr:DUF6345 domain-containing protein [Cylindrospermum stagnale]AFZ23088.1 hypothetical protein Cylst_0761 [Cylindrospermum stagnale PCC 7417]